MLEMKENQAILNEELERFYGRGAALLCEAASTHATERREPASAPLASPSPVVPGDANAGMVQRIVELFDGEVLAPGVEGGTV